MMRIEAIVDFDQMAQCYHVCVRSEDFEGSYQFTVLELAEQAVPINPRTIAVLRGIRLFMDGMLLAA